MNQGSVSNSFGTKWFKNKPQQQYQKLKNISKVEKVSEDSLDLIPSPSVEIQIIGVKIYLRQKVC